MIKILSQNIASYLVSNGAKQNRQVLAYGAECFLNEIISNGLLILVGIFTNRLLELLLWSLCFCALRVQVGGFHAPTHAGCIIGGTLVGIASLFLSPILLRYPAVTLILVFLSLLLAIIIAPVPHKNKMYLQEKRSSIKKKVVYIGLTEITAMLLLFVSYPILSAYIASAIIMALTLALLGLSFNSR